MLGLAKRTKARFLIAVHLVWFFSILYLFFTNSAPEVYGDPEVHPQPED